MAEQTNKPNSNVSLIDPNIININQDENLVNGIPQYQDMYIFAELVAESKGRTIIVNETTNSTDSKTINFIGNNQDNDDPNNPNPNYLNFTTNYYDGSTAGDTHYEGFGMESIKIVINSSFIPQVNIKFVDVRGLAFFNQQDSPYRILFDFPPPIFKLTVKGYYGKPLTYKLHLVKYTSEFSSTNGNFIIDAQFVAVTFAPLTDILFRYVVNVPLINNEESMNPKPGERPKNTFELILKLKNLYAGVSKKLETDAENIYYENILRELEKIDAIYDMVSFISENESLNTAGKPYLIAKKPQENDNINYIGYDTLVPIPHLNVFNKIIKTEASSGYKETLTNRLSIIYFVGSKFDKPDNERPDRSDKPYEYVDENNSNFNKPLSTFGEQLLTEAKTISSLIITDDDIKELSTFKNPYNIQSLTTNTAELTKYYGMDISSLYYKIYKKRAELEDERNSLSLNIARKINAMVAERLGMLPSIYNIFDVILNDVDTFFNVIKSTTNAAYDSHNSLKNRKIIIGDDSYNEQKNEETTIYPFPLVINKSLNNREERVAPINLDKKVKFPELELVGNFIDTFLIQNRYASLFNSRENQNDSGEYNWIPIAPMDSILGGALPTSPYIGLSDDVRTKVLQIMMQRFYIFTQGILPQATYMKKSDKKKIDKENLLVSNAYINLYAKAEAINLAEALIAEDTRHNLEVMSNEYTTTKLQKFYEDISTTIFTYFDGTANVTSNIYDFPANDPKYLSITSEENGRVYIDKTNNNFSGVHLVDDAIYLQEPNLNPTNPIDKFVKETKNTNIFRGNPAEYNIQFTLDNLMYFEDRVNTFYKDDIDDGDGSMTMRTRFLVNHDDEYIGRLNGKKDANYPGTNEMSLTERQQIAYDEGNISFEYSSHGAPSQLSKCRDIINLWSNVLGRYDTELIEIITGDTRMSTMLLLSNFGFTAGPFNLTSGLNNMVFDTAAAIQIPKYFSAYLGMLLDAIENGWEDQIYDFFMTGIGSEINLECHGFFVLADLHDVKNCLSDNDKLSFRNAYTTYKNNSHAIIMVQFNNLYKLVHANENIDFDIPAIDYYPTIEDVREKLYDYYFDKNAKLINNRELTGTQGQYYGSVMKPHIYRTNMLNYTQITFQLIPSENTGYVSLKELNESTATVAGETFETINNRYFTTLFGELNSLISAKEIELKNEKEKLEKMKGDVDIINQLYYSFKNINDKWLTGTPKGKLDYPFNKKEKGLINSFAFVDRGMNPIGETIINAEILGDMLDDPNISLFSVLTQLLSLNGFEFFPLQNFLSFNSVESWENCFRTHTGGYDDNQNPFFVCMYIGGSSSYPSVAGNGFQNDGIIDISEPGVKGFSGESDGVEYEENEEQEKNDDFPWRQVRAFRVRFGEQNQSMFKDMKIDSKEYPETNESIQILSRIAGDQNPDAPVPKGQNLYNLYENRSYKATVSGFGNAMIQPTQYFQLENIPMFNGAYIILNVEHNITANKMTTSFSGTKLLKYPIPRVLTPVAFTSYDGLSDGDIIRTALNVAPQATMISKDRLDMLDAELGIDVSHHNGIADWKRAKEDGVKLGIIKLTQGTNFYSGTRYDIDKQISGALSNNIPLGYYHFAEWGNTPDPAADGVNQANWFVSKLNTVPRSKMPVILGIEGGKAWAEERGEPYMWNNKTTDLNTFIKSFMDTITVNGYENMIYVNKSFADPKGLMFEGHPPLWMPNYLNVSAGRTPETEYPPAPDGFIDWDMWQFTSQGIVDGVPPAGLADAIGVDLNVVKKSFLKEYNIT